MTTAAQLELTAYHEAGHAVVGLAQGLKVTAVEVQDDGSGRASFVCQEPWPWRGEPWSVGEALAAAPCRADWQEVAGIVTHGFTHFELELTVNKDRTEPYALGDGYGHLAFSVADLDAEHQRIIDAGLNPGKIVAFNRDGTLLARFFFLVDPDGYKIEVLQRHGRYK